MHHYKLKIINSIQTGLFKNKILLRIRLTTMRIYKINWNNFKYKIKLILKIIIEMRCIYNKIKIKLAMVKLVKKMFLLKVNKKICKVSIMILVKKY